MSSHLQHAILLTFFVAVHSDNDLQSTIVTGNNQFGLDLAYTVYEDPSTNLWISPFSITSCFALIYPGCGSGSQTESQIASVLGYPANSIVDPDEVSQGFFDLQTSMESMYDGSEIGSGFGMPPPRSTIIGIANKIFSSDTLVLESSYINALDHSGESFIDHAFDFTANDAKDIINQWVDENTNGLIQEILSEDADISDWKLAALNAIYLNATFEKQFDSSFTSKSPFYASLQRQNVMAECHLMHQTDYFGYFEDSNYEYLKFSFSDTNDLFVLFVLPKKAAYSDQNGLLSDANVLKEKIDHLQSTYIALVLPKLSIEATYVLNEPLMEMGMTDAFTSSADFSKMSSIPLNIDTVIHKTMVEMDENGLVAAAVTLIAMVESSMAEPPDPILFRADHPFQMFIIDGEHDDAVLFMGKINDPGIPEGSEDPIFDEFVDDVWNPDISPAMESGQSRQSVLSAVDCVLLLLWVFLFV